MLYTNSIFSWDADICSTRKLSPSQLLVLTDKCECKWRKWVNRDLYFYWREKNVLNKLNLVSYLTSLRCCAYVYRDKAQFSVKGRLTYAPSCCLISSFHPKSIGGLECFPHPTQIFDISWDSASSTGPLFTNPLAWWPFYPLEPGFSSLTGLMGFSCINSFLFPPQFRIDHTCKFSLLQDQKILHCQSTGSPPNASVPSESFYVPQRNTHTHTQCLCGHLEVTNLGVLKLKSLWII